MKRVAPEHQVFPSVALMACVRAVRVETGRDRVCCDGPPDPSGKRITSLSASTRATISRNPIPFGRVGVEGLR